MSKLFVTTEGEGKPNLLFFHGLWGGGNYFRDLPFSDLPGTHFYPDELGFGKSQKPQIEYTLQQHCEEIMESLPKNKPYTLIGNSFGSTLALVFAQMYPEKVEQLILVSPVIHASRKEAEQYLSTKFLPRIAIQSPSFARVMCHIFCSTGIFELIVPFIRTSEHNSLQGCTQHTWYSLYSTFENGLLKEPLEASFETTADTLPIHVIVGEKDRYVHPTLMERLHGEKLKKIVVPNASHNLLFEQLEFCRTTIQDILVS